MKTIAAPKPSPTQRKILETAAGIASHSPSGRSQHGGWSAAYVVCYRNGWLASGGNITEAGRAALSATKVSGGDHEKS